jgi:ribosome-associated toxin RatA of RatAB toxin-antitoxin module
MTLIRHGRRATRAMRRMGATAALLCVVTTIAVGARTDDSELRPTVTVREDRGVYSVHARFVVPEQPAIALAVLTDYERIPQFMPGVETSVVIERGADRAVIEQEAVSRLMMFTKRVYLRLEIVEGPDTLRFRDRSGRSFARYEGKWELCGGNHGTWISYELTAQPAFDVPEFLLKRLLKRDAVQMIDSLRREIGSRPATRRAE